MSSREKILARLHNNRPDPDQYPLPSIPPLGERTATRQKFEENLKALGGQVLEQQTGETLEQAIKRYFPHEKVICSAVPEFCGTIRVDELTSPQQADKVDVLVVRSPFGIAETGSIFLSEEELHSLNSVAHLTQHIVVLLSENDLVANMHVAYEQRAEFHHARYGVLMSGPSATADIQGVLIRGAQGVRTLSIWWE